MTRKLIAVLLAAYSILGARADTWTTDPETGYKWKYQVNGDGAEIYNNDLVAISSAGVITIPSTLGSNLPYDEFDLAVCRSRSRSKHFHPTEHDMQHLQCSPGRCIELPYDNWRDKLIA